MFTLTSYNILSSTLASSCVPWVIEISAELDEKVTALFGSSFKTWVKITAQAEYVKHFHKNYASGHKNMMRSLWSLPLDSAIEIPRELSGLTFVSPDIVSYISAEGLPCNATTLRGLLRLSLAPLADEIYNYVVETEKIRVWSFRGPKIFERIARSSLFGESGARIGGGSDIISLLEYDVHTTRAHYRGAESLETFAEAMLAEGYSGIYMPSPFEFSDGGIALYWRHAVFELAGREDDRIVPFVLSVACDGSVDGAENIDLHDSYHPAQGGELVEFGVVDRKNFGAVLLRYRPTGDEVLVVFCHLMTESRDCPGLVRYPGQVRASELAKIKEYVELRLLRDPSIARVILVGDFNINLVSNVSENEIFILRGKVPISGLGGFREGDSDFIQFSTGWEDDETTRGGRLRWGELSLKEAFSDVHTWGGSVGRDGVCTSFNSKRCSWIDLMWYSHSSIKCCQLLGSNLAPATSIPNHEEPSDHLPISVKFEFVA